MNEVEENLLSNIEALENKYSLLKDQLTKFTKFVEDEKGQKEKIKSKSNDELKQMEGRIKSMLSEEREFMKSYVDGCFKKISEQVQNFENNSKHENEIINNNLMAMKEYMDVNLIFINLYNFS